MKLIAVIAIGLMLGACSSTIKTVNTGRAIQGLSKAGITESATNCIMDIFDPGNRGSGC
tara:strand:- start:3245 stop:3421 length:177 start_codon:yes stop_codon:yes gene_type:complete